MIKRSFDIFTSFFGLLFLSPILLLAIFLVWKEDKGSPFYVTKRLGKNNKLFKMIKLRSMSVDADKSGVVSSSDNDIRITSIGQKIRRYKLDEFIQLWNVLIGDMSIVGPRPHMNIQTKKYISNIDNYLTRNSVKPGITGLAQVSGYRGEVKKNSDIVNRVRFDIFYIENWSFLLDIKIILLTIFNMFKVQDNAY